MAEIVIDLVPPVSDDSGATFRATVVGDPAPDGHWDAWLEFVSPTTEEVWRTPVETHQRSHRDLRHWASTLGDVYLNGALGRARLEASETLTHQACGIVAEGRGPLAAGVLDPFELYAGGEHVLRRELRCLPRTSLLTLIASHDLNPAGLNLARLSDGQLATFIVTAVGAQRPAAS